MAPILSKIAIVGAGVSGIAAAKQLAHHEPIVFEASDYIGGVWKHCSYHSTKLQSFRSDYEFADFPWPNRDRVDFPSHLEILEYLNSYARHFDLRRFIRFNSKVVGVRFIGNGDSGKFGALLPGRPVWEISVMDILSETIQLYEVEMVVMCIGKYGDIPKLPEFPSGKGPEIFAGKVMHSLDYCKLGKEEAIELLKGKRVAIIGYKKSAIDLAVECAQANQEGKGCRMVVRGLHWTVPHYWVWGLPFFFFFSTRSSQFLHERPNQTFLKSLMDLFLSPMRHGVSKFIESYLTRKMPLEKYGLKPDHPFLEDYASCQMAIMPDDFFRHADEGKIVIKRTSDWWFWNGGIEFDDGSRSEFDVVIMATGFDGKKKLTDIFPQPFRTFLQYPSGMMPLYRGTINPMIPNMAFVGYLESVANLHTSELRSIWLARLVDEKFKLPETQKMVEEINEEMEVMKRSTRFYKRHCISTYSINHSDQICEEMGWNPWRKNSWFSEAFSPYGSQDYNSNNNNGNTKTN
ncbi:putative flavin-containing monooxygenase 1 [Cucumis melo var. makuwa]|uniref:Flavin-containing monooxygenase n=1 Tax=Cucumis melo var. makuwa TaxID=1194695 RepID=A0A5A7UMD2_CUCMM|nr:putative flavin-containing monooxygenase 1 [Cucumis melo var. makuwa]